MAMGPIPCTSTSWFPPCRPARNSGNCCCANWRKADPPRGLPGVVRHHLATGRCQAPFGSLTPATALALPAVRCVRCSGVSGARLCQPFGVVRCLTPAGCQTPMQAMSPPTSEAPAKPATCPHTALFLQQRLQHAQALFGAHGLGGFVFLYGDVAQAHFFDKARRLAHHVFAGAAPLLAPAQVQAAL